MVVAAALAAYALAYAGDLIAPAALLAGLGLLLALLALTLRPRVTVLAVLSLAAEYVLVEISGRVSTLTVVGYAVGLAVFAELVLWAAELPASGRADVAVVSGGLRGLVLIAIGAAALALLVLVASGLQIPGAVPATIAGVTAAAALLVLPWIMVRRRSPRR
jgi:hypothetical protein